MAIKPEVLANIDGAAKLLEWFGRWPSFHDAEVMEINLHRQGESQIRLHTWKTSDQADKNGYYLDDKNVIVTFRLYDVTDIALKGFNHQNIILELEIEQSEEGFALNLQPCFGVCGSITAGRILIDFEPGRPTGFHSTGKG